MKTTLFLLVQFALSAMLMWSCFCRLVKTDADTHREIRWAIAFEGLAAGLVLGAPFLPLLMHEAKWRAWTTPGWVWLTLLLAVTLVQIVTARYWQSGKAPEAFQVPKLPVPAGSAFAALLLVVGMVAMTQDAFAQEPQQPIPFAVMKPGDGAMCAAPEGCVAMPRAVFDQILEIQRQDAAKACKTRGTV